MRHAALLCLLLLCCNLRAQVTCEFHDTPLLDALRTINETSADYQVDILTDGLDTLRTSAQLKNLDVPAAVKRACKGLPVKVKVQDNIVCVQFYNPEKENKSVVLQGNVQDGFLERGLFGISLALLRADSTVVESKPTIYEIGNDSMHITTMYYLGAAVDPGRYFVRAQKDGYDDGWAEVEVPANHKGGNIKVPMINMRRS
ncbi:MAG: hypothetical protein II801_07565, partial [Bacteroidaceae bacterium]|nr:hypothetical protein [Bacteroidaceae bacterium]